MTPSHIQQQHFSRHDLECYKHVVPQASVIGISPNSVKIREDKAAFEAESRMKDKIIEVYQMHHEALSVEHQRTLQMSDNATNQMRSVFASSQKQVADSELLRQRATTGVTFLLLFLKISFVTFLLEKRFITKK